jgi:hypothetical protein
MRPCVDKLTYAVLEATWRSGPKRRLERRLPLYRM